MEFQNIGGTVLLFDSIAEKEMLMYQAVIDMVQENYDINSIKVNDITSRAGIGKGTAYEYFSSKEEIIVKALLFDTYTHLRKIASSLKQSKNYKERYFALLDYLEDNLPHTKSVGSLMKMFAGTYEIKDDIKKELEKIHKNTICPITYVEGLIDDFMMQGLEEKLYVQQDKMIRRSVFVTQVTGYIYCIINHYYGGALSRETAREFSYQSIIKLLNP